jgi:hypothetical protein
VLICRITDHERYSLWRCDCVRGGRNEPNQHQKAPENSTSHNRTRHHPTTNKSHSTAAKAIGASSCNCLCCTTTGHQVAAVRNSPTRCKNCRRCRATGWAYFVNTSRKRTNRAWDWPRSASSRPDPTAQVDEMLPGPSAFLKAAAAPLIDAILRRHDHQVLAHTHGGCRRAPGVRTTGWRCQSIESA